MQEVLVLMRSDLLNRQIGVRTHLAPQLPAVSGDRVRLQQVLDFVSSIDRAQPACVVLDLHMPGLNGFECSRRCSSAAQGYAWWSSPAVTQPRPAAAP